MNCDPLFPEYALQNCMVSTVRKILSHITAEVLGVKLYLKAATFEDNDDVYLQVFYTSPCTKTGEIQEWTGRKWRLSKYMTEDEVVKTAWCAVEAAVKHEMMEGFKYDNTIVFNPHVNFRELLRVSHREIKREQGKMLNP
jgi:hypothetical protein